MNRRIYISTKKLTGMAALVCVMVFQGCGANDLHRLHSELNRTAKLENAAAKTNHQFYETGIYGPVGSEGAINVRQAAAKAIHDSNELLIKALALAKALTPATFEQGKLAVLQTLAQAGASLHTGNNSIDLVLQGIATAINAAVLIIQTFQSSDLKYVAPEIQRWQIAEVSV